MEEEVGIKVTRLRRRLSVEADDVKSPSTQSTPTKKRGGRLAAKPQLELIDENAPETAPKRTRKSTARDIADPEPEKAVTPSRRSARVRSNTSIVSETPSDLPEDKGTPSRRSTRIKSNTSIIAETVSSVNSPRAKRAARRTSLAGSDNEAPVTPARQTRRTRKDSTSSIDKPAEPNAGKLGSQVTEVIVEESETNVKETKSTVSPKHDSPPLRKSPRLVGKSGRKSSSLDNEGNKENEPQGEKETSETVASEKSPIESKTEQTNDTDEKSTEQNNLSVASKNLITELEEEPTKGKISLNKSTTAVAEPQIKSKRNRTKSWTTISVEPSHENSFCSDSEASKKRNKKKNDTLNLSNLSGSGDGIMINNKNNTEQGNASLNSSTLSNKKKNKRHEMSMTIETESAENDVSKDVALNSSKNHDTSVTEKFFNQKPEDVIKSLVFIDDSDSNHGSIGKENTKDLDSGDQCVPVVDHKLVNDNTPETQNNLSYEPMDIDETMPENVSLTTFADKDNSVSDERKSENRKSISNFSQIKNDSLNKSKRKSVSESSIQEEVKSQRKSGLTEIANHDLEEFNKSKRKSSLSNGVSGDVTDGILSQSSTRKSIDDGEKLDKSMNKTKRKSSISNMLSQQNMEEDSNNSGNQSFSADITLNDASINKGSNKSKRKSSISNMLSEQKMEEDSNNSGNKSFSADITLNDASINKGSNKSKRKSSISNINSDDNTNEGSNKSTRKSAILDMATEEKMDNTLNKSKRKSLMTSSFTVANVSMADMKPSGLDQSINDDTMNKSSNKSKRNLTISNDESMNKNLNKSKNKSVALDKTDNENKSTLVLSQIKDVTETEVNLESNVPKDNNDSNDQLSKSVNVPNIMSEKETDKKNLSLTYSTSTPLQKKSMKKLGLQINSSIIAPSSVNKIEKKDNLSKSKVESSILSEKNDSESSEEDGSEEEEESSVEKSNLIDDEAEEASDDYESGDSRDDEEREYEEQNEIVEKGETLDSDEEEYSDDSDYEKGSFIVSSENEDDELLSGSGDDLDMSADELTMSAKSKKKFNERKTKEQKKASREMFEARHKLNESTKAKSKKNNRQRLDSTSSESDEEVVAQTKKNRRQRIDSSQDISAALSDADKSLSKKKKTKRLSESVCEENEKEITIREDNQADEVQQDPLTLQNIIKEEPKTPQKALDISTVAVNNMDEVEEVNVDENASVMKSNQTSDPLQATLAENNEDDDSNEDSVSENEEITQNYESVLNNLNKSGSKKIKSADISLNLNKKAKQKAKEPIVDQLNLTQVKKSKQKKADTIENGESKKLDKSLGNKSTDKVDRQVDISEGSSDSIDMKLLFPEDSNDSGMIVEDKKEIKQNDDVQEDFIPLKRSQAKTNILENTDMSLNKSKDESILNVSGKKKNKRKSSKSEEELVTSTQDENLGFYVDTAGTLSYSNNVDVNTSIKNSAKKNKQKNNVSFVNIEEAAVDDDADDAPLEVSYQSNKNKSIQNLNTTQNNEVIQADNTDGTPNQSAKKKKKNKKGLNTSQNPDITLIENEDDVAVKTANTSVTNVPNSSAKKKKKRQSESQTENVTENDTPAETIQNISLGSAKKNKQKVVPDTTEAEIAKVNKDDEDVTQQEQNTKKRKRKSSANQTIEEIVIKDEVKLTNAASLTTNNNQKKKRKISNNDQDVNAQVEDPAIEAQEQEKLPVENTKKKRKELQNQEVVKIGEEITKKNKKRKERDDDDANKISKVLKQNSFDKVHVPRLPAIVLNQLDDKPNKKDGLEAKKTNVVATSSFVVEETKKRRNKPSNYLEESVYLNDDMDGKKQKGSIKNPKVLPFIPTASTSGSGFTTTFKVNIIPQQTEFVAQSKDVLNFKNDYLQKKRIKKLGTFEMYKRQRNIKISKF
uniref:Protein slender lobes n=1 Tax=Heliothis virescens TaxID=7102 RepID=A0A2A4J5P6_HELVI